jgi:hypothetical protein
MITLHFDTDADETFGTKRGERDAPTEGSECGAVAELVMMFCATSKAACWLTSLGGRTFRTR